MLVAAYLLELVAGNDQVTLVADCFEPIFFHAQVVVALGVDKDLFTALLIFNANLIESAATFRTVRLENNSFGLLIGKHVRRSFPGVKDRTDNDRAIRIALHKINDDLVPDARQIRGAPANTRLALRNTNPARTIV